MSILDLFKKKNKPTSIFQPQNTRLNNSQNEKNPIICTNFGTQSTSTDQAVVSFEDRKKTAVPSSRGLYPAEILLLEYCANGTYPNPKNGYPRFWWFDYGIKDVDIALKSLENRGYIAFSSAKDSTKGLTVQQLQALLSAKGQCTTGKKTELVTRVTEFLSEDDLLIAGVQPKYVLTEIGQQELEENAYVPYMHRTPNKTSDHNHLGQAFNVWSINKLLGTGDKSNWKSVVDEQERKINEEIANRNNAFMKDLKKINPESYKVLKTQDEQIAKVQNARKKYNEDKDLDSYIAFWEMVWKNGGLKFEGVRWHFELPDLYIKAKRYDDALAFVTSLKRRKPAYAHKADIYIKKINDLISKQSSKNIK